MSVTRNTQAAIERWPWFRAAPAILAIAGIAVLVLLTENRVVGWEPGYNELEPAHHGWVSSHSLAIISHATAENGFVGFATQSIDESGRAVYDYFDRYPVFFSAGMHVLLSLRDKASTQVYLAKQAMNGVFLLTVVAAYILVRLLVRSWVLALAAVLLSVSSQYLLFYKDMVHYDQPALLGLIIAIYAIARHLKRPNRPLLFVSALAAVALGRGYATLAVLLVWAGFEACRIILRRGSSWPSKVREFFRQESLHVLLIASLWAAALLSYNILVEARKRGISPGETSIVSSAARRLALDQPFNDSYSEVLEWDRFLAGQATRIVRWAFPIWDYDGVTWLDAVIVALMLGTVAVYGTRLDPPGRVTLILMVVPGLAWMAALRNLTAFHDYTTMYYLGLSLAFYTALFSLLRPSAWARLLLLVGSLAIFVYRNDSTQRLHYHLSWTVSSFTQDFVEISRQLPEHGSGAFIYFADPFLKAPYAFGFYLPDAYTTPYRLAEYVVSAQDDHFPQSLTPDNTRLYLFRKP